MPKKITDQQKYTVSVMSFQGYKCQVIADSIGVTLKTLHKNFRKELDITKNNIFGKSLITLNKFLDSKNPDHQKWAAGLILQKHNKTTAGELSEDEKALIEAYRAKKLESKGLLDE